MTKKRAFKKTPLLTFTRPNALGEYISECGRFLIRRRKDAKPSELPWDLYETGDPEPSHWPTLRSAKIGAFVIAENDRQDREDYAERQRVIHQWPGGPGIGG